MREWFADMPPSRERGTFQVVLFFPHLMLMFSGYVCV